MQHPFIAKITERFPRGGFKGELLEHDVIIATFKRGAVSRGFVSPIEVKFNSTQARARFEEFSDSLSIGETIEAVLEG